MFSTVPLVGQAMPPTFRRAQEGSGLQDRLSASCSFFVISFQPGRPAWWELRCLLPGPFAALWLIMSLHKNASTEQCGVILFIHLKEKAIDKLLFVSLGSWKWVSHIFLPSQSFKSFFSLCCPFKNLCDLFAEWWMTLWGM